MEIYLARSNTLRFLLVAALLVAFQVGLLLSRKGLTIYVITVLGLVPQNFFSGYLRITKLVQHFFAIYCSVLKTVSHLLSVQHAKLLNIWVPLRNVLNRKCKTWITLEHSGLILHFYFSVPTHASRKFPMSEIIQKFRLVFKFLGLAKPLACGRDN